MSTRYFSRISIVLLGILLVVFFLCIDSMYYSPDKNETVVTIRFEPSIIKYSYFIADFHKGIRITKHLDAKSVFKFVFNANLDYVTNFVYIIFAAGASLLFYSFIYFVRKHKNTQNNNVSRFLLFFISLFMLSVYMYKGDIFFTSGTEVCSVIYKSPTFQKRYVFVSYAEGDEGKVIREKFFDSRVDEVIQIKEHGDFHWSQYILYVFLVSCIYFSIECIFHISLKHKNKNKKTRRIDS